VGFVGSDEEPTDEIDAGRGGSAPAGLAEPPLIASGRRLGDRYLLERPLGYGGMAVVWLATDERLGRAVAVKVLSDTLTADDDYLGRFRREAQLAAGLQHPNLVSIFDYDAGERPYLVMEYIEGGDLATLIAAGDAPPAEQLGHELLSALRHIHAAGVLHRDIKPQNVLVDRYGHARLSDFGIARPRDAASFTRTGHVLGTERYLAPEVMAGEPASEGSDLYALGVMLAGVAGEGPGAGAALWKLADEMRQPDPALRPASATAALAELERAETRPPAGEATQAYAIEPEPATAGLPSPHSFEPTLTGSRARRRRNRIIALAAVATAALVAVALALFAGGNDGRSGGTTNADQSGGKPGGGSSGDGSASGGDASATDQTTSPSGGGSGADSSGGGGAAAAATGEDGFALNDQGYSLVSAGQYEEAIPVLERAVNLLRDSGDQATFNYALYNLATAYLGAGRAADAIPLLEQRMQFDDGQLGEVQATLDRAYAAAGVKPEKPPKEPKPEKPGHGHGYGHGPKGGAVAPPTEEGGD
jgi:serine/threonine-protein kinase